MSDITIRPDDIGTPDVSIKVNVAGGMDGVGIEDITITGGAETDNDGPGGGSGGGSGGITQETDPTVPAWAKQPEKPTYTAEEVGAQPKGDYALRSEIPAVPVQSVNGKTGTVQLSAADVGALPAGTVIPEPYTLPTASETVKGGVIVGEGLTIDGDVLSVKGSGKWELIESQTLTEDIEKFVRTEEPNGKPYNLSAIKIIIQAAPETTTDYWFPKGYDENGKEIVGAAGSIPANPAGSQDWYRTSLVFNATPLYGFYDCWVSSGTQGNMMNISRAAGAKHQTQTTETKIAKIDFGLYRGVLAKNSSYEIWGVRA